MSMDETWALDETTELPEEPLPNPRVAQLRGEGRGRGRNRSTNNIWTIDTQPNPPEANSELMESDLNILKNGTNKPSKIISLKNNHRQSRNPTNESLSLEDIIRNQQETKDVNNFSLDDYVKEKKITYDRPKYGDNNKKQKNGRNDENMDLDNPYSEESNFSRGTSPTPSNNSNNGRRFRNNYDNNNYNNNNNNNARKVTPDSCLYLLSTAGFAFEHEISQLKNVDHPDFQKRRWRVVYLDLKDETMRGVGEGPRKSLAKECAALDLVENIRKTNPSVELPECDIQQGARISPYIETLLGTFCKDNGFDDPVYVPSLINASNGREMHQMSIEIGSQAFRGKSCDIKFAKLLACKQAYNALTNREFRLDPIIRGDDCLDESEYKLEESAERHLLHSNVPMPDRPVGYDSCTSSLPGSPILWNHSESVGGESGRGTPSSVCSAKRIKIATSSEELLPPILRQIRQQAQNEANKIRTPLDVTDGPISIDELPQDENMNLYDLPNGMQFDDADLETPSMDNLESGFAPYASLNGNRKRSMDSAFVGVVGEQDMNSSSGVHQVPKPILKGLKRTTLNTASQVPIHKYIEDNWDSVKMKILDEMKIWEEISDDDDDEQQEDVTAKKKNTLTVSAIGFSNTLAGAEKAACTNYGILIGKLAELFDVKE